MCKSFSLVFNTIANKHAHAIAWKRNENLPFFKEGGEQNVANCRFNSILSCTLKLLETLIFGKLYEVIKDIIAFEEYGFRKNRPSITQMIMYMSEIFDNPDSTTLATIYLNFEKAFDKVSHGKFFEKLTNASIRVGVMELIESYLKGRKHKVKIESSASSKLVVTVNNHESCYLLILNEKRKNQGVVIHNRNSHFGKCP